MWTWFVAWAAFASDLPTSPEVLVPGAEALKRSWEQHQPAVDKLATWPLRFDDEAWARVAAGEVARRREKLRGIDRIVGLIWVPASQDVTWIAVLDDHMQLTKGYVTHQLPSSGPDETVEHGSLDLPWPLATRHWVVRIRNNLALRDATQGAVWERAWSSDTTTPTPYREEPGVWLQITEGGWYYVAAEGGTLLAYHARTEIGGVVPDDLATRWAFGRLDDMLLRISERTQQVPSHYAGAHAPILRPGAKEIPRFAEPDLRQAGPAGGGAEPRLEP